MSPSFPTPPQGPAPPQGPGSEPTFPTIPCTPQLAFAEITPSINTIANGTEGSFILTPSVSTMYRVRSFGVCGGGGPGAPAQIFRDTIDTFYEIIIDSPANCGESGDENLSSAAIFQDYAWLLDIVNPTNCASQSITVYQSGAFELSLIHI